MNGDVDTSKGTGYLAGAAYTCKKGYRLEGQNVRICQADDTWSDAPPVCMIYGRLQYSLYYKHFSLSILENLQQVSLSNDHASVTVRN